MHQRECGMSRIGMRPDQARHATTEREPAIVTQVPLEVARQLPDLPLDGRFDSHRVPQIASANLDRILTNPHERQVPP